MDRIAKPVIQDAGWRPGRRLDLHSRRDGSTIGGGARSVRVVLQLQIGRVPLSPLVSQIPAAPRVNPDIPHAPRGTIDRLARVWLDMEPRRENRTQVCILANRPRQSLQGTAPGGYVAPMALSLDPNKVVDEFQEERRRSFDQYLKLWKLMPERGHNAERQQMAVDAAFRLGIQWQTFQHNWLVASISKSPGRFVARIQGEIDKGTEKIGYLLLAADPERSLSFPARPKRDQIVAALDPAGFNIAFTDHQKWIKAAHANLDAKYADTVRRVVEDTQQTCILDLLIAIRNYGAHQSNGALRRFNSCIRTRTARSETGLVGDDNIALFGRKERGVQQLGPYLHRTIGADRRVGHLDASVMNIADRLRIG